MCFQVKNLNPNTKRDYSKFTYYCIYACLNSVWLKPFGYIYMLKKESDRHLTLMFETSVLNKDGSRN